MLDSGCKSNVLEIFGLPKVDAKVTLHSVRTLETECRGDGKVSARECLAELIGERDQGYCRQFQEFTRRLQLMADLHDLVQIRDSLAKSAIDLKARAEAMAAESQQPVARLREDVRMYQVRLDEPNNWHAGTRSPD